MPLSNKGWDETASCSTDLRRQSRCRPAPTDTRAQARGDARMVSDESDGKAGKSADEVRDEFEEKMDRLRRQYERDLHSFRYEIEEREYRLKAYEDKFNKIKQPPLLYAYVVRKEGPDLDGNQVVVARATELLKVSTGLMDKSQLGIGQYVWVHPQTYAIVEGSAVRNEGVIAKVADMMDGKLVISIEGDMEKRLIDTDKTVYKKLKPGFQISVLPPTMEVLEVLPNLEVKSLLLGEKPNVNYGQIGGLMEAIERIKDVVVLPYQEAKLFAQIALEAPRGILLYEPRGPRRSGTAPARAVRRDHRDPASRPKGGGGNPADLPERSAPGPGEPGGSIRRAQGSGRGPAPLRPRRTVWGEQVGQGETRRGSEGIDQDRQAQGHHLRRDHRGDRDDREEELREAGHPAEEDGAEEGRPHDERPRDGDRRGEQGARHHGDVRLREAPAGGLPDRCGPDGRVTHEEDGPGNRTRVHAVLPQDGHDGVRPPHDGARPAAGIGPAPRGRVHHERVARLLRRRAFRGEHRGDDELPRRRGVGEGRGEDPRLASPRDGGEVHG